MDAPDDPLGPQLPRELQLEITGACNLACRMCLVRYRPKLGRREGTMCLHLFRRLVDSLPELERLTLQGLGEPLWRPTSRRWSSTRATAGSGSGSIRTPRC